MTLPKPIVHTTDGKVQGRYEQGIMAFKGIPFAAPPIGRQRFVAPVRPEKWSGVRDVSSFSPTPPQSVPEPGIPGLSIIPLGGKGWVKGHDYLTLNVWTPDLGSQKLPVMVFIYGGSFVAGGSSVPLYNGGRFARDGVVLVSFNYRLGIEGFLLMDGGDANLGLRDQIAALIWVQENIAAFGGDPGKVTIFGESAGAIAVDTLLAIPSASGLFHRAISQSGGAHYSMSREQAARITARFGEMLGIKPDREGFSALTAEQLIAAQEHLLPGSVDLATEQDDDPTGGMLLFMPIRDGDVLAEKPMDAITKGLSAHVDVLAGTNSDEMHLNFAISGAIDTLSEAALYESIRLSYPRPDELLASYRSSRPLARPGELLAAIIGDWLFGIPTIRLAEAHAPQRGSTYLYEFAWKSPTLDGKLGACHALELGFVFDMLDVPELAGPAGMVGAQPPVELAQQIHSAWIAFATNGDPGWAPYDLHQRSVMRIDTAWEVVNDPHSAERLAWNGRR